MLVIRARLLLAGGYCFTVYYAVGLSLWVCTSVPAAARARLEAQFDCTAAALVIVHVQFWGGYACCAAHWRFFLFYFNSV